MPFIGQDWRAPGETWVKTTEGWEQMKLRPLRTCSDICLEGRPGRTKTDSESSNEISISYGGAETSEGRLMSHSPVEFGLDSGIEEFNEPWLPHCFVKTNRSKEFVGCASMTEAFLKLDLARALIDVQRFNYVCKVAQIFVCEKLPHLSGSGRKILLALIESIVTHCLSNFKEVNNTRGIVGNFMSSLNGYAHHCGSKRLLSNQKESAANLLHLLSNVHCETPAESDEESVTFLDLPVECLRSILRQLPDHDSLLTAAEADQALETLVHGETDQWRHLAKFHFVRWQIDKTRQRILAQQRNFRERVELLVSEQKENMVDKSRCSKSMLNKIQSASAISDQENQNLATMEEDQLISWRHLYFELKKHFGLKEMYADMIHICCHCKALFWKGLGHPCIGYNAPSVRVTPQQFVEMLLYS